jgi:lysophospholipase L1-like esterase
MSDDGAMGIAQKGVKLAAGGAAQSVVILGDSITEQLGYANQIARHQDVSYFTWANALMGGRFLLLNNAGRGSTRTTFDPASDPPGMGVRLAAEVLAYKPDWCWILGGSNDINSVGDDATIVAAARANLTRIIETCIATGIRVMIGTVPPTGSFNPDWSPARVARMFKLNAWIRSLPGRYRGLVVADYANVLIDPTSSTGQPRTGMLQKDDAIHPAHLGAYTMGMEIKRVLEPITASVQWLPSSMIDRPDYYPGLGSDQLFPRPFFHATTGGTNSTAGTVTGDVPGSMTLSKSGTWGAGHAASSVVPRADGFGNDWVMSVTNSGANNDNFQMAATIDLTKLSVGDTLIAACSLSVSGLAQWKGCGLILEGTPASGDLIRASSLERSASDTAEVLTVDRFSQANMDLTPVTGPFRVEAGLTSLRCFLRPNFIAAGGTATIKWGRVAVWRVPAVRA